MSSKCFIVLGMHRSATSLSAKGLHDSGVCMGEKLLGMDQSNPYGHYEDIEMSMLNRKILKAAGGSWDNPPRLMAIRAVADQFETEIKEIIAAKKKPLWGWKDPRTTLTIDLFFPYIENPHFIACFREPNEVARSLQTRNGFPIAKGLNIAKVYNARLLFFLTWFSKG